MAWKDGWKTVAVWPSLCFRSSTPVTSKRGSLSSYALSRPSIMLLLFSTARSNNAAAVTSDSLSLRREDLNFCRNSLAGALSQAIVGGGLFSDGRDVGTCNSVVGAVVRCGSPTVSWLLCESKVTIRVQKSLGHLRAFTSARGGFHVCDGFLTCTIVDGVYMHLKR